MTSPDHVESTISGRISGVSSVDFNAYLNTGTNSVTSGPGFEGDFSSVVVTTLGAQTGSTGRVQEAQNMVTAGGTVHVNSGTYVEQVNVTKSLSLLSINGAASTVITSSTGGYVGAITVATGIKNVTIGDANKGFTLSANAGNPAALYMVQDNDGAVVKGNIVNGGVTGAVLTGGAQDSVLFESNAFSNSANVPMVYINGTTSVSQASTGVNFINNTFTGSGTTGLMLGTEAGGSTISGNTFTGANSYAQLELWATKSS
jgi:hypothetical protein